MQKWLYAYGSPSWSLYAHPYLKLPDFWFHCEGTDLKQRACMPLLSPQLLAM